MNDKNSRPELQIRGGFEDNANIIFLISQPKHVVIPYLNCLNKAVLMWGQKICFMEK